MATTIFAVVGQHRDDPDHPLVLGDDGLHYDLHLVGSETLPVEPDDTWALDERLPDWHEAEFWA